MKKNSRIAIRTLTLLATMVLLLLVAAGCSQKIACDQKDVKALALELTQEQIAGMLSQLGVPQDEIPGKLKSIKLKDIVDISPAGTPDEQCGCQATVEGPQGSMTVVYTVEETRDGNFYVQLQGLQ